MSQELKQRVLRMFVSAGVFIPLAFTGGCGEGRTARARPSKKMARTSAPGTEPALATRPFTGATDRQFLLDMTGVAAFEVESAKLATRRVSDGNLRSLAEEIASDFAMAAEAISQLSRIKGVAPPGETNARHRSIVDRLTAAGDAEFAEIYLGTQIQIHREMIDLLTSEIQNGVDEDAKAFAAHFLPLHETRLKRMLANRA